MRKKISLILQRDSMQCGASCLAMICSYFEKNKCIEYLSEQCFATTEGVSLPYWTRKCVSGCISSPHTLQDYLDRKIIPYTQFAGKIIYKASDLEWLLEEKYKVQAGEYSLYLLEFMKRRKLYENLQTNTNLPRNREKNSIDGTYGHIHVKKHSHEYAQRLISVHFTAV